MNWKNSSREAGKKMFLASIRVTVSAEALLLSELWVFYCSAEKKNRVQTYFFDNQYYSRFL